MTAKESWANKLKQWQKGQDEARAKVLMSPPGKTTILRTIPFPGVIVILGSRGSGKSALAYEIMAKFHTAKHLGGALLMPHPMAKAKRKLLPNWVKTVSTIQQLPQKCVCVIDEAAQVAHARRTQSAEAVSLDNLISISRHRKQLIIVVVHHSRKLDLNIIHDSDQVIWKEPTEAHALFERDEIQLFTRKALEFFAGLTTPRQRWSYCYCMDFHHLRFTIFRNALPPWWSEELSDGWA
jgi:hypothetical protein